VDPVLSALRWLWTAFLPVTGAWPALATLAPISLLTGVAMLWAFGKVSDQDAVLRTRKRLNAALYELRLFTDEPGLMFRAQRDLLAGNARYLALMLKPAVILTIPMILLLAQLDAVYGRKPLPVGQPALVTIQMRGEIDPNGPAPALEMPVGISVETPAVRVLADRQVCWRVRPVRPAGGSLRVVLPEGTFEKSVDAGSGLRYLSARRVRSLVDQIWYAGEKRLVGGNVEWIEIAYPPAEVMLGGFGWHWLIWFLVLSFASAWFLRKRFGVTI